MPIDDVSPERYPLTHPASTALPPPPPVTEVETAEVARRKSRERSSAALGTVFFGGLGVLLLAIGGPGWTGVAMACGMLLFAGLLGLGWYAIDHELPATIRRWGAVPVGRWLGPAMLPFVAMMLLDHRGMGEYLTLTLGVWLGTAVLIRMLQGDATSSSLRPNGITWMVGFGLILVRASQTSGTEEIWQAIVLQLILSTWMDVTFSPATRPASSQAEPLPAGTETPTRAANLPE